MPQSKLVCCQCVLAPQDELIKKNYSTKRTLCYKEKPQIPVMSMYMLFISMISTSAQTLSRERYMAKFWHQYSVEETTVPHSKNTSTRWQSRVLLIFSDRGATRNAKLLHSVIM